MTEQEKTQHAELQTKIAAEERVKLQLQFPAEPMLQFFAYAHLPQHLQTVSAPFASLALTLAEKVPRNPERTVALRKLLEAKDCAVRAVLYVSPPAL